MYNVNKIFLGNGTAGTRYRGHGSHAALKIWLAHGIIVPLHRQSGRMAFRYTFTTDGWTDGAMDVWTEVATDVWQEGHWNRWMAVTPN